VSEFIERIWCMTTIAGFEVVVDTRDNTIGYAKDGRHIYHWSQAYDGGETYYKCCAPCMAAYGPYAGDPRGHCPCPHCNPRLAAYYDLVGDRYMARRKV
jgi:hypothetical protein